MKPKSRGETLRSAARHVAAGLCGLVLLAGTSPAGAVNDEYVQQIEGELKDLGLLPGGQRIANPGGMPASVQAAPETAASARDFEQRLRESYPGSYFLYKKLSERKRSEVYAEFKRTGSLDKVRTKLFALAKSR